MRFSAVLELHGKTATGFEVPAEVVAALGTAKRPPVRVTVNGHTWASTVAVYGGTNLVGVSAENRAAAGVAAGDVIEVDLELDTSTREVVVPDDLAAALGEAPAAKRAFDELSYSNRRRHVLAVEGAKAAETRARRIEKIVAELTT